MSTIILILIFILLSITYYKILTQQQKQRLNGNNFTYRQLSMKQDQISYSVNNQNGQVILTTTDNIAESLLSEKSSLVQEKITSGKTPYLAAMFGMMASALGAGIFNMSIRITDIGVGLFFIYIFIGGAYSYFGCLILQQMIIKKGYNTQGQICQSAYGKSLKRVMQVCLFLFPFGIGICIQVIIAKFLVQILNDVFKFDLYDNRDEEIYNNDGNLVRILINFCIIVTNFALIQMRDISKIQKLSSISIMTVIYNSVTIFILMFTGFTHYGDPNVEYQGIFHLDWDVVQWFNFDSRSFSKHSQAIASFLYVYINHQLVFPTCKNMQNPTNSRLKSCFFNSVLYQIMVYIVVGMSGYLLLVPHQDMFPIPPLVLASINVWPMTVGKFLLILSLYITLPLNLFPARTILKQILQIKDTNKNHYLLSIGLAASTCIFAILFVKINSYFGLLGGTAGVLMSCAIPSICYWKLIIKEEKEKQTTTNYLIIIFMMVVSLIAFIGGILSVADPA